MVLRRFLAFAVALHSLRLATTFGSNLTARLGGRHQQGPPIFIVCQPSSADAGGSGLANAAISWAWTLRLQEEVHPHTVLSILPSLLKETAVGISQPGAPGKLCVSQGVQFTITRPHLSTSPSLATTTRTTLYSTRRKKTAEKSCRCQRCSI
jgi:hypothetical protein